MSISFKNSMLGGLLSLAVLALSACGGGAGTANNPASAPTDTPTTGTVGIFITDAPTDRFDKILVQVTQVDLLGDGQPATVFRG